MWLHGNLDFKNTNFTSTDIQNLSELEIGNYVVTCKATSKRNEVVTGSKTVKIMALAKTQVIDENSGQSQEAVSIYSAYDLAYFRDLVNKGQANLNAKLQNDIDMKNICAEDIGSWVPIGKVNGQWESYMPYSGIFDGSNAQINNLYVKSSEWGLGLFGAVIEGTIKNMTVSGKVENTFKGDTAREGHIGGMIGAYWTVGENKEKTYLKNLHNEVEVQAPNLRTVGGIAGSCNSSRMVGCSNRGKIVGKYFVGGIVGEGRENIDVYQCYNVGEIQAIGGEYVESSNSYHTAVRRNSRLFS